MASPLAIDQCLDLNDKKKKLFKPVARYIDSENEVSMARATSCLQTLRRSFM